MLSNCPINGKVKEKYINAQFSMITITTNTTGESFSPHSNPKKEIQLLHSFCKWENGGTKR